MCSIYGAIGRYVDPTLLGTVRARAMDRGRDGHGQQEYTLTDGRAVVLGNHRATPTPELESGRANLQPYYGVVHNGTIANDRELGGRPGEVDSEVLPRILDRSSLGAFADSLKRVVGSYALACVARDTVYLAVNYKPLYYYTTKERGGYRTTYFSSMARHLEPLVSPGNAPVKLDPYTAIDLTTYGKIDLLPPPPKRAVVVASGGLDSTVAAAALKAEGYEVLLLHLMYGCRAQSKESRRVTRIAETLGCKVKFLELPFYGMDHASSLLSDTAAIADGAAGAEYAHEWVPARNLVMMSLAVAYAEANGYHYVALGNNLEEAGAYPDNEEEFTHLLDGLVPNATQNGYRVRVVSPVGRLMKHEIVALGSQLDAPLHLTWSCYKAGEKHCGKCGPCFMRRTAFARRDIIDPTEYEGV